MFFLLYFLSLCIKNSKLCVILCRGYAYSRGYVYCFCNMFQGVRLFKGLRLFQSLEYSTKSYLALQSQKCLHSRYLEAAKLVIAQPKKIIFWYLEWKPSNLWIPSLKDCAPQSKLCLKVALPKRTLWRLMTVQPTSINLKSFKAHSQEFLSYAVAMEDLRRKKNTFVSFL